MIQDGKRFTLFATGRGVPIRTSPDLVHWDRAGSVFPAGLPAWASAAIPGARDLLGPGHLLVGGGIPALLQRLDLRLAAVGDWPGDEPDPRPGRPDYRWVDRGLVLDSAPGRDDFNAIDPNVVPNDPGDIVRDSKRPWIWLTFGSFWGGIKIVGLDAETGKPNPARWGPPRTIAARPGDHAIEAPFLYRKDGWYYLFASVDHCCRGAASDYNVVVGRSRAAEGPYLDLNGRPMTEGGGSPVIAGSGSTRGPGHNAVLRLTNGAEVFAHHYYDADDRGTPKLQVRRLVWGADGWPLAGAVVDATIAEAPPSLRAIEPRSIARRWAYSHDFADPRPIRLLADGQIEGDRPGATWTLRTGRCGSNGNRGDATVASSPRTDGRSSGGIKITPSFARRSNPTDQRSVKAKYILKAGGLVVRSYIRPR